MLGLTTHLRRGCFLAAFAAAVVAFAVCLTRSVVHGQSEKPLTEHESIVITAVYSREWEGQKNDVAILRGPCKIVQGNTVLRAQKMVVWRHTDHTSRGKRDYLDVFLEGDARVEQLGQSLSNSSMFLQLSTSAGVTFEIRRRMNGQPATQDSIYQRAQNRRRASQRTSLLKTQLVVQERPAAGEPELRSVQFQPNTGNVRRIHFFPRSSMIRFNVETFKSEDTTPPEQVWVLTRGVNLLVEGVDDYGTIDLAADRMVVWTRTGSDDEFQPDTVQTRDTPFTVYLEGNIVIRQGRNVVRASQAVYDAREDRALLLDAELKIFVPQLQGALRVRAKRIRQLSRNSYHARNAWMSSSRFGKPGYRLQANDVFLENRLTRPRFGTRGGTFDSLTGAPFVTGTPWVTSLNNTFLIGDFPLLYTPYLSAPAENPNVPLRRASAKYDRIFGGQLKTTWNLFQLLGWDEPPGTQWDLMADIYTSRGPAIGTGGKYAGSDLFGVEGTYFGEGLAYYILDDGEDNLGLGRRNLSPEQNDRGRIQLRHRQNLPYNVTVLAELGYLSDRNFLEQYYENEFDENKDVETLLYGKQQVDNWAWTFLTRPQVNDFTTTTAWLPRGDLFSLSEPLLGGLLTWSSHTSAGYARLRAGDTPSNPADLYTPLPFVADLGGAALMTRHEFDLPFSIGPIRVVPYLLGEAAFWNQDFTRDEIDRFIGSGGIRSSLMFWKIFPYVQSRVFNLNGLAHKAVFEAEYAWTDSTEDLAAIPQYNEFDDNAQERFRNRFLATTFGGVLPAPFEPRFYSVRTGAGRSVTAPYHELIDDQQVVRLALRQRLQTKVGPPQRLRIKDWMTLDAEISYFPNESRDNFGEEFGLIGGHYRWNVGERSSLLASAFYDLFDDAQQLWNVAVLSQRSERGSVYFGIRQVKGATLDSQIFTASYSYKMSPKWISTFGTAYDLAENFNRGQSLTITRIGADFLFHVGASFDNSKNNAGLAISIEPRFGPFNNSSSQLSSLLGNR